MNALQQAKAQLAAVNIDQDPIGALDACLGVLGALNHIMPMATIEKSIRSAGNAQAKRDRVKYSLFSKARDDEAIKMMQANPSLMNQIYDIAVQYKDQSLAPWNTMPLRALADANPDFPADSAYTHIRSILQVRDFSAAVQELVNSENAKDNQPETPPDAPLDTNPDTTLPTDPIAPLDTAPSTPQLIEHVTKSGNVLSGIILTQKGLKKIDAKQYDKYTFWKQNGDVAGWFIRAEHLDKLPPDLLSQAARPTKATPQPDTSAPAATAPVAGITHDNNNSPKAPYDKLSASFAVEQDQKADITYPYKDAKKLLAKALKEAFPGTRFGIKSAYSSRGIGYTVEWVDGPSDELVNRVLNHFVSYQDGELDHSWDFRLPGKNKMARDADGKLVYYGLHELRGVRKLSEKFVRAVLEKICDFKATATKTDTSGAVLSWHEDTKGDLYHGRSQG